MRAENNKFTSMPYIPFKIVMALLENDNFCKLLYYNTIDALDQPNLTIAQKRALMALFASRDELYTFNTRHDIMQSPFESYSHFYLLDEYYPQVAHTRKIIHM